MDGDAPTVAEEQGGLAACDRHTAALEKEEPSPKFKGLSWHREPPKSC